MIQLDDLGGVIQSLNNTILISLVERDNDSIIIRAVQ